MSVSVLCMLYLKKDRERFETVVYNAWLEFCGFCKQFNKSVEVMQNYYCGFFSHTLICKSLKEKVK